MACRHPICFLLRLFIVSVVLNTPWEIAQAFLYQGMDYSWSLFWHCFVAALGDGVLVCGLYAAGWATLGRADWFARPGWPRIAVMVLGGLVIGIAVEWLAVYQWARWSYTAQMPLIPGLGVGLVPILQMVLVPLAIFAVAQRWSVIGLLEKDDRHVT